MEVKAKVKVLVTIFDHKTVEIPLQVPEFVKGFKLLPSVLEKYTPTFFERCEAVTYSILYINFLQRVPDGTKAQFFNQFMTTQIGFDSYKETFAYVSEKLKKTLEVSDVLSGLAESSSGNSDGGSRIP